MKAIALLAREATPREGRRLMQRNAAYVGVLSLVVAATTAGVASAAPPVATTVTLTATNIVTGLCAFPVTVQGTVNGTLTTFSDSSGTPIRASLRGTEQDVLSANGVSLTGLPHTDEVTAPIESDGSYGQLTTYGVQEKVPLPDGSFFISAGRGVVAYGGFVIIPQSGGSVNLAGLCAALAG